MFRLLLLASMLVLAASAAAASDPGALLRRQAEAFVGAMNASGDDSLEAFARDHLESRLTREGLTGRIVDAMNRDFRGQGPIDRFSTRVLGGGEVLFVTCRHSGTGAWWTYQFRVLEEDARRLQLVFVSIAVEPMERPATPIDSDESSAWLGKFTDRLEQQQPFSGVVAVRRRDREVFSLVRGMADAARGMAMTRDTRLNMASGSKLFTAVAILQLAQAGRLSVDDTLSRHLPDFPGRAFADRVTLHQLLTHTAGAGNYWDEAYEKEWGGITALPQMIPFVLPHLGDSPAGEFEYSNSGYILLGLVIEAASGMDYYDYVGKHILEPAGMHATGFPIRGASAEGVALPYEAEMEAGLVKPGSYVPVELGARGSSAGGASTTAADLMRFAAALRQGTLLDEAHLELLMSRHVPFGDSRNSWYGYGCIIEEEGGVTSFGHGGMGPGTQFEFKIYPELETTMVVMSNLDTIAVHELSVALDGLIRNEAAEGR